MLKGKNKSESTPEKAVKKPKTGGEKSVKFAILGILMALVIISIAYSTSVIILGTKGLTPKIMLAPQVAFAGGVLLYAFSKIFK